MSRTRAAFTLVELLVALTVLGLMMVMVTRSLGFVATARERAAAHGEMAQSLAGGLRILGGELARALPMRRLTEDGSAPWFEANGTTLRFLTANQVDEAGPPFSLWQLRLLPDGNGQLLEARRVRGPLAKLEPRAVVEEPARTVLRTQVPLAFRFRQAASDEEPAAWVETWERKRGLPEAVMLTAVAGPDEAWPPWIVPLRVRQMFYCDDSYSAEVAEALCPSADESADEAEIDEAETDE